MEQSEAKQIDDGGPAFPVLKEQLNFLSMGKEVVQAAPGMALRDWFAGQAIAGLLAHPDASAAFTVFAADAYDAADAMLQARRPAPEKGERT